MNAWMQGIDDWWLKVETFLLMYNFVLQEEGKVLICNGLKFHFQCSSIFEKISNPILLIQSCVYFCLKMCFFFNGKLRGGLRKVNDANLKWAKWHFQTTSRQHEFRPNNRWVYCNYPFLVLSIGKNVHTPPKLSTTG